MKKKTKMTVYRFFSDKNPNAIAMDIVFYSIVSRTNDIYKNTILSRDARMRGDEETAKMYKRRCGGFTPAVICEGGRQAKNIVALTQICIGDFDHIPEDKMKDVIIKVREDDHTYLSYVTNSQLGIRVLFRWTAVDKNGEVIPESFFTWDRVEPHEQFLARVLPFHRCAYEMGNDYYSHMLELPFDPQTKDINRMSFFSHSENASYNEDPSAFVLTPEDVAQYSAPGGESASKIETEYERIVKENSRSNTKYNNVLDLIEDWVRRRTHYVEGSYNRYVSRCAYLLCEFGVDEEFALQWAHLRFPDYAEREVTSIVRSCYRNGNWGVRTFY